MKIKQVKIPFTIEIPEDWELVSNRKIFVEHNVRGKTDLDLLSVSQTKGVIPQNEILEKKDISNEDKSNYKEVMKEYIVYNKMRMWQGAVGISKYEGIVSPAYVVLKKRNDKVLPEFFHYQFRSSFYIKQSSIFSYGLCDDMNSLRYEDFKNMKSVLPPKDVQQKIVDSIILNGNLVEQFINKRLKYIELLKEYKQSKINELVTKGINPNVKMKESGIKWIGKVPEHWHIRRLKNIFNYCNRGEAPNYVELSDTKVVNQATFSKGFFDEKDIRFHGGIYSKGKLIDGDLLMASTGGGVLGKVYLFNQGEGYMADSHVTILRSNSSLINKFYYYFFLTNYDLINGILSEGSTNQTELQKEWLRSINLVYPEINEMEIIINEIEKFEKYIEKAIEHTRNQIELIQQYRQSLIYELVTGKRKP